MNIYIDNNIIMVIVAIILGVSLTLKYISSMIGSIPALLGIPRTSSSNKKGAFPWTTIIFFLLMFLLLKPRSGNDIPFSFLFPKSTSKKEINIPPQKDRVFTTAYTIKTLDKKQKYAHEEIKETREYNSNDDDFESNASKLNQLSSASSFIQLKSASDIEKTIREARKCARLFPEKEIFIGVIGTEGLTAQCYKILIGGFDSKSDTNDFLKNRKNGLNNGEYVRLVDQFEKIYSKEMVLLK